MKKLFIVVIVVGFLVLFASYILIPSVIRISVKKPVSTTVASINNLLLNEHAWKKWWPGTSSGDSVFLYNGYSYYITGKTINSIELGLAHDKLDLHGILVLAPVENDSIILDWQYQIQAGSNPFKRIGGYLKAQQVEKELDNILQHIKNRFEDTDFVYGTSIRKEKVTDTLLVTTKMTSTVYPSVAETYRLIHQLESLVSGQHVKTVNPPMLHIQKIDSAYYQTMAALPINKWVVTEKDAAIKRMVMGNILVSEVTGGPSAIQRVYQQMQQYISDHNMSQPAIPYQSLITNRMEVTDTAKWVTKIYFPVY